MAIEPTAGHLALGGNVPVVAQVRVLTATAGALTFGGHAPTILLGVPGPSGGAHVPRGSDFPRWRNPPSVWWGLDDECL